MLRAGNTATGTREWMEVLARKLGVDALAVSLALDSIAASVRGAGAGITAMREVGSPGINAWRIGELQRLARTAEPGLAPSQIAARLDDAGLAPPLSAHALLAGAIGAACGGFAFLNGTPPLEMTAAAIGGWIGQSARSWLARRHLNQFGVAALCAIAASATYLLV